MNLWFRMYSEIADDPKVQMMPEAMQRRLVMLMCLKCKERLGKLSDMEVAFELRIPFPEASETKALFLTQGFIDEKWDLVNWNKRQFLSDSSTERTRRYRERHETSRERHCDGAEQNRTEQKQKKPTPKAALSSFAIPPSIDTQTWAAFEESRRKLRKPMTDRARKGIVDDLAKLGGDPNALLVQSITRGWAGVFELKTAFGSTGGRTNGKGDSNLAVLERVLAEDQDGAGADGDVPAGDTGRLDFKALLGTARQRAV